VRVEIVEEDGIKVGKIHHLKGEVLVSDGIEQATQYSEWVQVGWAKDLDTGQQGERKAGPNKIDVKSIRQAVSVKADV